MSRRPPLPLAVLVCTVPVLALAADPRPGTSAPRSEECSVNAEGSGHQDCGNLFTGHFQALAGLAGIGDAKHVHFANYEGVGLVCDFAKNQIKALEDLSPVVSVACGEKMYTATGYGLFHIARDCEEGGVEVSRDDVLAAIASHELAHLAAGHNKDRAELEQKICKEWGNAYLKTQEGKDRVKAMQEEFAKTGASQADVNAAVAHNLISLCLETNRAKIAEKWRPFEKEADVNGQQLLRSYLDHAADRAYVCAMKVLQDYEWATSAQVPAGYVSEHPKAAARVATARGLMLAAQARDYCAASPKNPLCRAAAFMGK